MAKNETSGFAKKYYNLTKPIAEFFTRPQSIKLKEVDFDKPWWQFLFQFKGVIVLGNISELFQASVQAVMPLIIAYAINNSVYSLVFTIFGLYTLSELLNRVVLTLLARVETSLDFSILNSGLRVLLKKDPKLHIFKSTGESLSKLNKGASAYRTVMWMLNDGLVSAVMGFITTFVASYIFSPWLALVVAMNFMLYNIISFYGSRWTADSYGEELIKNDDRFQGAYNESLMQVSFIRSLFATNEQISKTREYSRHAMHSFVNMSFSYGVLNTVRRTVGAVSVAVFIYVLITMVDNQVLEIATALALVTTYLTGYGRMAAFGNLLRDFIERVQRVNTLFDYIRDFGPQTYPVLEGDKVEE
jgi:ABC-type multidrug transport system fused ATPase/permease subunit